MRSKHALWLLLPLLFAVTKLKSQDDRPPVTRTYFINNAYIVTQPGTTIELGGVIVRDGLIEAVGKGLTAPVDAKVMEGDTLYVYAGFIDGLSHVAVPKPKDEDRPRVEVPGNPPREVAGIVPERSVVGLLAADDKSIVDMRQLGFTAAHVVPRGNMLPGKGAVILLGGDSPEAMVLRDESSLFAQFKGSGRMYPSTTMAIFAKWRELYERARQGQDAQKRYRTTPRGSARPAKDEAAEAFYPVLSGAQPVFFAVDGVKEVYRAFSLADELGFPLALGNLERAQYVTDELKKRGTPVFLRMELPEAKKDDAKKAADGDDPEAEDQAGVEAETGDPEKEANRENSVSPAKAEAERQEVRRADSMEEYEGQAAALAAAGIPFGFSSLEVKPKDVRENLRRMIAAGLTEDQALTALTTAPAKLLGLSDVLGTVERGKIANLVITDAPYFAEKSNVRYVFVDGVPTEYEVKKKKARKAGGEADAEIVATGSWTLEIDAPGQDENPILILTGSNDDLSGTLGIGDESSPVSGITLDGDNLIFSTTFDAGGQTVRLDFDLTISGDYLEGSVSAGNFGSFDVEGERTPE